MNPHTPENWGAASREYAELAPRMMQPFATELLARLEVGADMEAVEVAAGTGALTLELAQRAKHVLATDFAPGMIEVLRERAVAAGCDNVTCEVMDGMALDIEDARYDRGASSFGMMLFPDRAKGFAELRRVLRPGGRAAVSGWAGPAEFESFAIFLGALKAAFPDLPPPPAPPAVFSLADPASFVAELETAGFANVRVDKVATDLELTGFDELWTMLSSGAPPVKIFFDRIGDEGIARLRDALAKIVADLSAGERQRVEIVRRVPRVLVRVALRVEAKPLRGVELFGRQKVPVRVTSQQEPALRVP